MNIIIPMAGRGSRLRPHTLTVPKPLIPLGGIPIVHRLVADISSVCGKNIENIGFVTGDFGKDIEDELCAIAQKFNAKGHIFHQLEPLGTGHAVMCAQPLLEGPVVVAFADTLFRADFTIHPDDDGILWVKRISNPEEFGVIKLNESGNIVDFIEKPQNFVSDLAMIGVYYFKSGEALLTELNHLVEFNIIKSGEYQLPDALRRLTEKGTVFKPGEVKEWLDCGNKSVTVETHARILDFDMNERKIPASKGIKSNQSVIIPPCFIGEDVTLNHSIVGPYVSIGNGTKIDRCVIENSIIQQNSQITNCNIQNSMIGSNVRINKKQMDISLGDFNEWND